jgi:LmeA-like phospholipid-binding
VSEYPNQPRPPDGWPAQPPRYSGRSDGQPDYGQADYGQGGAYGQPDYGQADYGPGGASGQGGGCPQDGYPQEAYGQSTFGQPGVGQAGYSDYRTPRMSMPRRRRRGRGWIALLITLVVLAVVFVIGDQVAKGYAQNMIAGKLQSQAGLPAKPAVTIEGWPFLTQVAAHDIRTVDISATDVQAGKLVISSVKATATGVHLNSSFNGGTIDHISGTALITFPSLVSAAGAQGVTIAADPARGPNAATVSLGPFSTTATATQTGPNKITIKIASLSGIAASIIGQLPNYTFTVPKLPAGLQLQGVSVTSQGLVIKVAAHDTTLSQ